MYDKKQSALRSKLDQVSRARADAGNAWAAMDQLRDDQRTTLDNWLRERLYRIHAELMGAELCLREELDRIERMKVFVEAPRN